MKLSGAVVTEVIGSGSAYASLLLRCRDGDIVRIVASKDTCDIWAILVSKDVFDTPSADKCTCDKCLGVPSAHEESIND